MSLKSMTGFARSTGSFNSLKRGETQWTIELRSVNGKGLDVRVRMPNSLEGIEANVRRKISNQMERGSLTLNINLKNQEAKGRIELNKDAFNDVLAAAHQASDIAKLPMPGLDALLSMRQVLQEQEMIDDEDETKALLQAIEADVETVINALVQARLEEGTKLGKILGEKLETIKTLVTEATTLAKEHPAILKNRLEETINKLLENKEEFDPERLHQEAVLLAVKADVAEELDRLQAHIEQAASLLESGKPIGRRLDFLCQEFNREANTLCSKSQSKELTYIGLELKTVIDQFREQVQNIE